jgi:hypothetical protein
MSATEAIATNRRATVVKRKASAGSRRAYGPREWGATYGIGLDGVYQAIREGKLIARKFGKRTIITEEDGDRFIASLPRLELPPNASDENARMK